MRGPRRGHDFISDELQLALARRGELSWANQTARRRFPVQGHWPDVVVVIQSDAEADVVQAIYEVETAESARDQATQDRWNALARLGVPLSIVVPDIAGPAVLAALEAWRLSAAVVTYRESPGGGIEFRGLGDAQHADEPVVPNST